MSDTSIFPLIQLDDAAQEDNPFVVPPPSDVSPAHRIAHHAIPSEVLDPDALKVLRRLTRFGYEAYLVGGCVRDILFGQRPKDFDVATSALPSEIKRLFRNCRLIGRRFRLAHLLFKNGKVIEVATFRRSATSDDDVTQRHAAENLFGGPADDAVRRDFTINALMYDVNKKQIHDYVGGLSDIEARALNTIGDPDRRFTEDPVRIIRAIKFATRLDLTLDPPLWESMKKHAHCVKDCAPARLVEEMLKLFQTGKSAQSITLLHKVGVLGTLLPALSRELGGNLDSGHVGRFLMAADKKVRDGQHVTSTTLLGALIYPFCLPALNENGDLAAKIHQQVLDLLHPMKFPKRQVAHVRQIIVAQRRLAGGPKSRRSRRILEREYAAEALDLMEIVAEEPDSRKVHEAWLEAYAARKPNPRKPRRAKGRGLSKRSDADEQRPPRRARPRRRRREIEGGEAAPPNDLHKRP